MALATWLIDGAEPPLDPLPGTAMLISVGVAAYGASKAVFARGTPAETIDINRRHA